MVCKSLSHTIKRKIIGYLAEENLSFTQLLSKINGFGDSGKFGYHLRGLTEFVELEPTTKKYQLTYRGRLLSDLIREFYSQVSKGNQLFRYAEQLVLRDHAFVIFNSESFKRDITFPFLKAGLSSGYAAVYAVGEEKLDYEVLAIKKSGVDLDSLPKGALTVMPSFEWYIQKGKAEAKTITENWQMLIEEKREAGFAGLQVAGETAVFIGAGKGNELMQYEASLGRQLGLDMCAICLYDKKSIEEIGIPQVLKSHGHIISEDLHGKTNLKER
jgi:hypothetical protein